MPAVWQDRFARYLKHALSLRESTELSVLPDLMPVLPVIDPTSPELLWARGESLFIANYLVAGVVAEYGVFLIKLPATAGHIVIVDHFSAEAAAPQPFLFSFDNITRGVVAPATALDRRAQHPAVPQSTFQAGSTPGLLSGRYRTFGSRVDAAFPVRAVLGADSNLVVQCETVNTTFLARIAWRERAVQSTPET